MIRAGVIGATGYVGGELVRLLASHPGAELSLVTSERGGGEKLSAYWPQLHGAAAGGMVLEGFDGGRAAELCDVVFVALPHGRSMDAVASLCGAGLAVIDMSADFRLGSAALYESAYGESHRQPALLGQAVYGLPELKRDKITALASAGTRLVASPGCYPTATILALLPLVKAGLAAAGSRVIVDAKSGVSGAGRVPSDSTHFNQVNDNFTAYKVGVHRHAPEMELHLGMAPGSLLFVPHLVPMDRGILATVYVDAGALSELAYAGAEAAPGGAAELRRLYEEAYSDQPFVHLLPEGMAPQTKAVRGTNNCQIGVFAHQASGQVIVISAIDNLVKGAAGQGVQAMNLMFGLDETAGLTAGALIP